MVATAFDAGRPVWRPASDARLRKFGFRAFVRDAIAGRTDIPSRSKRCSTQGAGDTRVRLLVAKTIDASRVAGRPIWPPELVSEMRATVAGNLLSSWSPQEFGMSR